MAETSTESEWPELDELVSIIYECNPSLQQIHLNGRKVNDAQCRSLLTAMKCNSIVNVLDLQNNNITSASGECIAECLLVNRSLTELNLNNNRLGDTGGKIIDAALDNNHMIRKLNIDLNGISGRLMESIATKVELNSQPAILKGIYGRIKDNDPTLTSVELSSATSTPLRVGMLVDALRTNTCVTYVGLAGVNMSDSGAESLVRLLKRVNAIKKLDLSNNNIGPVGMRYIAEAITQNSVLEWISLEGNNAGDNGCRCFIEALKQNNTVQFLNLSQNGVSAHLLKELRQTIVMNANPLPLKKIILALAPPTTSLASASAGAGGAGGAAGLTVIDLSTQGDMPTSTKLLAPLLAKNSTVTRINMSNTRIGDAGVKDLAEALKTNTTITSIDLSLNDVTAVGVKSLAECLCNNSTVTEVNLSNNDIGTAGAVHLLHMLREYNDSIIALHIELNDVDVGVLDEIEDAVQMNMQPKALKRLAPRITKNDEKLREIDFSQFTGMYLSDYSAKIIARALKTNSTITALHLANNNIGDVGTASLSSALKLTKSITSVDLSHNNVCDRGAAALSESLTPNSSVTSVNLDHNNITEKGVTKLIDMLWLNYNVKYLSCRQNRASAEIQQKLETTCEVNRSPLTLKEIIPRILANDPTATRISLSNREFDSSSVYVLCNALKTNTSVTKLCLSHNEFGKVGAEHIASMLRVNTTLRQLDLSYNALTDSGAALIARSLTEKSAVGRVILSETGMEEEAGEEWILAALRCAALYEVRFDGNQLPDATAQRLRDALAQNSQPKRLRELLVQVQRDDPAVTVIDFSDGDDGAVDDVSCRIIAIALINNHYVTKLNLMNNQIGPEGAQFLADMLEENDTLKTVNMNNNSIGEEGARALLTSLNTRNDTLKELWIEGNSVPPELSEQIGLAIQMNNMPFRLKRLLEPLHRDDPSVSELVLDGDEGDGRLDDGAIRLLAAALRENTQVGRLVLRNNSITDAGVPHIAQMIRCNRSLQEIDLSYNLIGGAARELCKALMSNACIWAMSVHGNPIPGDVQEDIQAAVSVNIPHEVREASWKRYREPIDETSRRSYRASMNTLNSSEFHSGILDSIQRDAMKSQYMRDRPEYLAVQYRP